MIKAIILGNNIYGYYINQFICRGYNLVVDEYGGDKIEAVAYWDYFNAGSSEDSDLPILTHSEVREYYTSQKAEVLLIPYECYNGQNDFLTAFFAVGLALDSIYIAKKLQNEYTSKQEIMDMFVPYYSCRKLPYLEYHIADHCNLKCANCEHYSGLVPGEVFPDVEKFSEDIHQLKKLIDDIGIIRILGGEPLLNPQIEEFIRITTDVYPDSLIRIVTNALLLKTMPETFFDTVNSLPEGSGIDISLYPVMEAHIESIKNMLKEKKVSYSVSPVMNMFRKQQKLAPSKDDEMNLKFYNCFQKGCVNLYDGKIAACFLPFTTKYFNSYFDKNLPEDGWVDLYEEGLTTEMIRQKLSVPFERCRYCMEPVDLPWHVIHEPSVLEDWV